MSSLLLLVLGAIWAAVLVPPMLRNRVENRPNNSVTDFRRQLNKLQNTVPSRGNQMRMARPLTQSPLQRQAAPGRPGQPAPARRSTRSHNRPGSRADQRDTMLDERAHGRRDGSGEVRRATPARRANGQPEIRQQKRQHGDSTNGTRRPRAAAGQQRSSQGQRPASSRRDRPVPAAGADDLIRRRRTNVMIALVILAGGSLFLAATTTGAAKTVMLYIFGAAVLVLFGYGYLISQSQQRQSDEWGDNWIS